VWSFCLDRQRLPGTSEPLVDRRGDPRPSCKDELGRQRGLRRFGPVAPERLQVGRRLWQLTDVLRKPELYRRSEFQP